MAIGLLVRRAGGASVKLLKGSHGRQLISPSPSQLPPGTWKWFHRRRMRLALTSNDHEMDARAGDLVAGLPEYLSARCVFIHHSPALHALKLATLSCGKQLIIGTAEEFYLLRPHEIHRDDFSAACNEPRRFGTRIRVNTVLLQPVDVFIYAPLVVDPVTGGSISCGQGEADIEFAVLRSMNFISTKMKLVSVASRVHLERLPGPMQVYDLHADVLCNETGPIRIHKRAINPSALYWNRLPELTITYDPNRRIVDRRIPNIVSLTRVGHALGDVLPHMREPVMRVPQFQAVLLAQDQPPVKIKPTVHSAVPQLFLPDNLKAYFVREDKKPWLRPLGEIDEVRVTDITEKILCQDWGYSPYRRYSKNSQPHLLVDHVATLKVPVIIIYIVENNGEKHPILEFSTQTYCSKNGYFEYVQTTRLISGAFQFVHLLNV